MTKPSPTQAPTSLSPLQNGWLSIVSVSLGVISILTPFFGFVAGIPAIITGIIALVKKQPGRNMSIAGIILGAISTLLSLLFLLFIIALVMYGIDSAGNIPEFNPDMMQDPPEWIESSQT